MEQWIYQGQPFPESLANQYFGFIYEIRFATGHFYIGRKQFDLKEPKIAARWQNYFSSSKVVKQFIADNPDVDCQRIIIKLCKTKGALIRAEEREIAKHIFGDQILMNNLFCLNRQITRTDGFAGHTPEAKEKIGAASRGRVYSAEKKANIKAGKRKHQGKRINVNGVWYSCIGEACESLGYTRSRFNQWIYRNKPLPSDSGIESIQFEGEPPIEFKKRTLERAVVCQELIIFKSIREAERYTGYPNSTISAWCDGSQKPKPNKPKFRYATESERVHLTY